MYVICVLSVFPRPQTRFVVFLWVSSELLFVCMRVLLSMFMILTPAASFLSRESRVLSHSRSCFSQLAGVLFLFVFHVSFPIQACVLSSLCALTLCVFLHLCGFHFSCASLRASPSRVAFPVRGSLPICVLCCPCARNYKPCKIFRNHLIKPLLFCIRCDYLTSLTQHSLVWSESAGSVLH